MIAHGWCLIFVSNLDALTPHTFFRIQLNGAIPRELGSLHFLVELRVRENKLAGKMPPLLSNMRSLQVRYTPYGGCPVRCGNYVSIPGLFWVELSKAILTQMKPTNQPKITKHSELCATL